MTKEAVEFLSIMSLAETAHFEAQGKTEVEICEIERKYSDIASRLFGTTVFIGVKREGL